MESEKFYPRCYDFTEKVQIDKFITDFHRTAIFNILKSYGKVFEQVHWNELQILKKKFEMYKNYPNSNKWINNLKNISRSKFIPSAQHLTLNTFLLKAILKYTKRLLIILIMKMMKLKKI